MDPESNILQRLLNRNLKINIGLSDDLRLGLSILIAVLVAILCALFFRVIQSSTSGVSMFGNSASGNPTMGIILIVIISLIVGVITYYGLKRM